MRGLAARLRAVPAWAWLIALIALSAAARMLAALRVPTPLIAPDEMTYAELGRSLWSSGSLDAFGRNVDLYSVVYPALIGPPLAFADPGRAFALVQLYQPLLMSLAAVPVYLWTRRLAGAPEALLAAALTLAGAGLAYSALLMTEVAFYPAMALVGWRIAVALSAPSLRSDLLALGAIALAVMTRLQAIALVPALLAALLILIVLERSFAPVRRSWRLLAALGGLTMLWLAWRVASGGEILGVYAAASGGYSIGDGARYVAYHLADLALLVAFVPLCALLLVLTIARREGDPELRALCATATGIAVAVVVQVGVFASQHVGHLSERSLLGVAPALFVAFAVWLARGAPRPHFLASLIALAVAAPLLLLPVKRLSEAEALHDSLSLVATSDLGSIAGDLVLAFSLLVATVAVAFVLVPRPRIVLPVLVFAMLVAVSTDASRYLGNRAQDRVEAYPGAGIGWIAQATSDPVLYLHSDKNWDWVWRQLFWNPNVRDVVNLGGKKLPGPAPQRRAAPDPSGELKLADGAPLDAPLVVAGYATALRGAPLTVMPRVDGPLILWKAEDPVRLSTVKTGVLPNGDIPEGATLDVYDCRSGIFRLTLIGKEAADVNIQRDGRPLQSFRLLPGKVGRVEQPFTGGNGGICRYTIGVTGYTGSTLFEFHRV